MTGYVILPFLPSKQDVAGSSPAGRAIRGHGPAENDRVLVLRHVLPAVDPVAAAAFSSLDRMGGGG